MHNSTVLSSSHVEAYVTRLLSTIQNPIKRAKKKFQKKNTSTTSTYCSDREIAAPVRPWNANMIFPSRQPRPYHLRYRRVPAQRPRDGHDAGTYRPRTTRVGRVRHAYNAPPRPMWRRPSALRSLHARRPLRYETIIMSLSWTSLVSCPRAEQTPVTAEQGARLIGTHQTHVRAEAFRCRPSRDIRTRRHGRTPRHNKRAHVLFF